MALKIAKGNPSVYLKVLIVKVYSFCRIAAHRT